MKYRFAFGGNRSGKSHMGSEEAAYRVKGEHPFLDVPAASTIGWISTLDVKMFDGAIKETWEDTLRRIYPGKWKFHVAKREYRFDNGSVVYIKSEEAGREKYGAAKIHWCWCDEEHSKPVWDEIKMRLIDYNGRVWTTMTPLKGKTWVYYKYLENTEGVDLKGPVVSYLTKSFNPVTRKVEDIEPRAIRWDNKNVSVLRMSIYDNYNPNTLVSNLPAEALAEVEEENAGTSMYLARIHGEFVSVEGLVFDAFGFEHIIDPVPLEEDWIIDVTVDWGYNKPNVALFLARTPQHKIYVIDELVMHKVAPETFLAALKQYRPDLKISRYIADCNQPASSKTANNMGIPMRKSKKDKSMIDSIGKVQNDLVRQADGTPRLRVFRNCRFTIANFENYRWLQRRNDETARDKPEDHNNDALDSYKNWRITTPFWWPEAVKVAVETEPMNKYEIEARRVWKDIKTRRKTEERARKMAYRQTHVRVVDQEVFDGFF
jgi:phage terminase large subunit-like protein